MSQVKLPKVLVIDVNAWREDAPSNTLKEIFSCWNPENLALIYTSSAFPSTTVCSRFFQIGEMQVLQSVFRPWKRVGREVSCIESVDDRDNNVEQSLRNRSHQSHSRLMRLAREFVWKFGHWRTRALRDFINDFNPDLIFVPIFPYAYMGRIQEYIIHHKPKPTVCYLADDNYSYDSCTTAIDYFLRSWNRKYVRRLARNSQEMFVIVDKEKEDTDSRFGTNSVILTKGIDIKGRSYTPKNHNYPLNFVYTGSLVIGRDSTLAELADVINQINREQDRQLAELYIYSQNKPSDCILSRLNVGDSHFCGSIPHQDVEKKITEADVVVFAEALSGKQANIAKLSFSTKLTDYLSLGKCILAIGKEDIAPIDYLRRNNAAVIASSKEELYSRVKDILCQIDVIDEYGKSAFDCAVINHDKEKMAQRFISTMCRAVK